MKSERHSRKRSDGAKQPEGGPASRACARGVEDSASGADSEITLQDVTDAEVETVANAIETGTPKTKETIADIIRDHPQIRRLMVAAAVRCTKARRWYFDTAKKRRVEDPDWQTRFRAIEWLADRAEGRPAQAVLNLNVNGSADGRPTFPEKMSPAAIEAMERALARAKAAQTRPVQNRGAKESHSLPATGAGDSAS